MRPDLWASLIATVVSLGCNAPDGTPASPPPTAAGSLGGDDKIKSGQKRETEMKKAYTVARDRAGELMRDWDVLTPVARLVVVKELRVAAETLADDKKCDAKGAEVLHPRDDIVSKTHLPTRKPGVVDEPALPRPEALREIGQKVLKKLDALCPDAKAEAAKSDLTEIHGLLDPPPAAKPGGKGKPE